MARSTYNWWRRNKKRKTLPTSYPLLLRIRNGDFETSQYLKEAMVEMKTLTGLKEKELLRSKKLNLNSETTYQNVFNATDEYQRRYNRLMKDLFEDEQRILKELRKGLTREFKKDLWEQAMESCDGSVEDLYWWYKKELGLGQTPSEIAIQLGRNSTKGL